MTHRWRPVTQNQLPDALSHLPRFNAAGEVIDDSLPCDESSKNTSRGSQGPVLDAIPLSTLGVENVDDSGATSLRARCVICATGGGHAWLRGKREHPGGRGITYSKLSSGPLLESAGVIVVVLTLCRLG